MWYGSLEYRLKCGFDSFPLRRAIDRGSPLGESPPFVAPDRFLEDCPSVNGSAWQTRGGKRGDRLLRITLRMSIAKTILSFLILLSAAVPMADGADVAGGQVRFNRDIRPILSENCFYCHGPDEGARTADLRLDTEAGAKDFVIVEGDALSSELIARITSDDPDELMPPADSARSLSKADIEMLRRWIDQGAAYEIHWSFIPPQRPAVPAASDKQASPIDRFILEKLDASGLTQATAADRTTLIRRASFDLTGLPPTVAEIDTFLADQSPGAYERLLDGLLARSTYGERMASDWLDVARYSDTYGYQVDRDRFVWPWRDWVIAAFNDNLPYDQFVTQQLAGDLLPHATTDQILATTFNRLHSQKVEGGSVAEEFRIEYVADRVQTVATSMMGLTLECCRCHDHKYDPLSQREYYELSAFFDNIDEAGLYSFFTKSIPTPTLRLPTPAETNALTEQAAVVNEAQHQLDLALTKRESLAKEWMDETWMDQVGEKKRQVESGSQVAASEQPMYAKPVESLDFESDPKAPNQSVEGVVGKGVQLTGDDAIQTKVGNFRRFEPFSVSLWMKTPDEKDRAVIFHRSRAWTDAASRGYQLLMEQGRLSWSLIHFWPGNAIGIRTVDPIPVGEWVHVVVTNDGSSRAAGLNIFLNGEPSQLEQVRDSLTKNITGGGGDTIAIGERFRDRGFHGGSIDQFRVFDACLTPLEAKVLANADTNADTNAQDNTSVLLDGDHLELLTQHYLLRHDTVVRDCLAKLKQSRQQLCGVEDAIQEIMVMREMQTPRQSYLLQRGAYDNRRDPVDSGTPAVLNPFPAQQPRNRLGLARWLTDPDHPLTSRVAVNRLWQLCFGSGLVRTPEDFGSQGEVPTHPDLLDWLAVDFVQNGWDVKRTLKQIMMSATYRQSSRNRDHDLDQVDPRNRLLARFPSYRLSAEMLRDNSLAISGRLVSKIGGPPAKPYEIEASFKPTKRDKGDGLYRRSVYTYWKRTGPAPAMMALDASKRDVCRVQRERTSSPLQAFVLLNGPQYIEASRGLAERLIAGNETHQDNKPDGGEQDGKPGGEKQAGNPNGDRGVRGMIQEAFRTLTSRRASDDEMVVLLQLYKTQRDYFRENDDRAKAYLGVGDAATDGSQDPSRVAALTVVISTVMNFDQSVMKR